MREYILEKTKNTTRHFKFGTVIVNQEDPAKNGIDFSPVFRAVEDKFPSHYFKDLKGVEIAHRDEFDERNISALYTNDWLYISDKQDKLVGVLDDLIHEMAHHLETTFKKHIYGDDKIRKEFLKKRSQLEAELRAEGYWTEEYDFTDIKYNKDLDMFLYERVGKNLLRLVTAGIYIRPYASVSIREYFATGFEAYYMGNKETLFKLSPMLYNKIDELHNL